MNQVKRIIVAGGGFAGVSFMKKMSGHPDFMITLVDQNNYHFFPPLIYQVATAFIEPSNISYPFRRMFQSKNNLRFHMGTLMKIQPETNTVETDTGVLEYDILVLAIGTKTNYFGIESVTKNAYPLKSINDALNLRNHLLLNLEKAVQASSIAERERHLNIVIAGGGPTGVEVAGMLAEMSHTILRKEYPEFAYLRQQIHLIDAGPVLLGPMSKKSQKEAEVVLRKLGVHIRLNTAVKEFNGDRVVLSDGTSIESNVLIWASGVTGVRVEGLKDDSYTRGNRLLVDQFNCIKGYDNIYALGDICFQTTDKNFPNGHPQLAQVAMQQGKNLAINLKKNDKLKWNAFQYKDKGSMAIISKYKAVADLPNLFFKGFAAWFVWLFIHILPIAGFRNKFQLAFNWFWAFITNDPTLRLIIRPSKKTHPS